MRLRVARCSTRAYSSAMTSFPRPLHRLVLGPALGLILPLLVAPPAVSGATVRKTAPRATAPIVVRPNDAIIALPLNPIVPAAQRLCTTRTASGLGYTMLRPAAGARPTASGVVLVNYIGYLASTGAVFDQGMRSALRVDGVIPGFSQGLLLMARSSVARFCIPAAMGYGSQASGPIPANSDLVFQVELVDFRAAGEDGAPDGQAVEPTTQKDGAPRP